MTIPPLYIKKSLSIEEQIEYLISKNVIINNKEQAKQILGRVSYYRLKGYMLPFKDKATGKYSPVSFATLLGLLKFDQDVRSLILKYTEHIEITLRTFIVRVLCSDGSSLGFEYKDPNNFINSEIHKNIMYKINRDINRSDELYITHYKEFRNGEFPLWVCIHVLSFGTLYQLFWSLKHHYQREITGLYGNNINRKELSSSLSSLTYLRNKCAHFNRIYYTPFIKFPMAKVWHQKYNIPFENKMLFVQLVIMKNLCVDNRIWHTAFTELSALINNHNNDIQLEHIGFPQDWESILK